MPERHVHRAKQARRRPEVVRGTVAVADVKVQPADPQVAARDKGTHLQLFRQRDGR